MPADCGDDVPAVRARDDRDVGHLLVIGREVGRAGRVEDLRPLVPGRVPAEQPVVGRRVGVAVLIEGDAEDRARPDRVGLAAHVLPRPAVVVANEDAIALVGVLRLVGLAGAKPQRPVGRIDRQRPGGHVGQVVGDRGPVRAVVVGAPHAAVGRAREPGAVWSGREGGDPAAHQGEAGPDIRPERVGVIGRLAVIGLGGELLPVAGRRPDLRGLLGGGADRVAGQVAGRRGALEVIGGHRVRQVTVIALVRVGRGGGLARRVAGSADLACLQVAVQGGLARARSLQRMQPCWGGRAWLCHRERRDHNGDPHRERPEQGRPAGMPRTVHLISIRYLNAEFRSIPAATNP